MTHGASSFIYRGWKTRAEGEATRYAAWDIYAEEHAGFRICDSRGVA